MSATITPYLFLSGRCEEALQFYKQALGAEIGMVMRFSESPDPTPPGMLPPNFENKVMHSEFTVKGVRLMGSDGCEVGSKPHGFKLAMTVDTEAEARKTFDALAAGGQVEMPLTPTFWSPCYGMVTDKFGIEWMVMVPGQGPPK